MAGPASGPVLASYAHGAWQRADVPPVAGTPHGTEATLSCLSPDDCALMDDSAFPATVATLAKSGGSWHVISRDTPRPAPVLQRAISCTEGLCVAVGASEAGSGTRPVAARARFSYIALGDSYSAGEGAQDYFPGTATDTDRCHRSANAYPVLLAKLLGFSSFSGEVGAGHPFGARSGTLAIDLTKSNHENKGEPPQESHLTEASAGPPNPDVDLVTLNLGGNDMDFGGLVTDCVGHGVLIRARNAIGSKLLNADLKARHFERQGDVLLRNSCQRSFTEGLADPLTDHESDRFPTVRESLKRTIEQLHSAYLRILSDVPGARVLVVGYPDFFPSRLDSDYCAESVTRSDTEWASAQIARFDAAIEKAVEQIGNPNLSYVTPTGTSGGWSEHTICAKDPWFISPGQAHAVETFIADHSVKRLIDYFRKFDEAYWSDRLYFHPTPEGQRQLELSVRKDLGQ